MPFRKSLAALAILLFSVSLVTAAPPLKALMVDGQMNKWHPGTGVTPALKSQLEETKLFQVDVATSTAKGEDMSRFAPDFKAYDVVVLNYDGDDWPGGTKKAFVDYVRGGGGSGSTDEYQPLQLTTAGVKRVTVNLTGRANRANSDEL